MTYERGMRRILVVLSGLVVIGWAVAVVGYASLNGWAYLAHHTTYRIQAPDGHTYEITGPPDATYGQVLGEVIRQNPKAGTIDLSDVPETTRPRQGAKSSGSLADLGAEPYRATQDRLIDQYLDRGVVLDPAPVVVQTEFRWLRGYSAPIAGYALLFGGLSLGLIWGTFYTLRWIARGFRGETR